MHNTVVTPMMNFKFRNNEGEFIGKKNTTLLDYWMFTRKQYITLKVKKNTKYYYLKSFPQFEKKCYLTSQK